MKFGTWNLQYRRLNLGFGILSLSGSCLAVISSLAGLDERILDLER